jgi:multidrug efflux pump subunit AcrA (membrane-fusion protein)
MFVEVELVAGADESALLVPKRALVYDEDQVFLYRVNGEQKAERLRVSVELEDADFVSVARDASARGASAEGAAAQGAVAEGDLIVVAGQTGLRNGAAVRMLDPAEALATFANGRIEAP